MCVKVNITPTKICSANLYRHIARIVGGAHLVEHTARETWSLPKSKLQINYLGLKAAFSGPKRVPGPLCEQYSSHSYSGCLYKQGG